MKTWYRESAENVLRDMGSSRSGTKEGRGKCPSGRDWKKGLAGVFGTVSGSSGDNPDCCSRDFHGI